MYFQYDSDKGTSPYKLIQHIYIIVIQWSKYYLLFWSICIHHSFWYCSIFGVLCNAQCIIVCPFDAIRLVIAFPVHNAKDCTNLNTQNRIRYTSSRYGIEMKQNTVIDSLADINSLFVNETSTISTQENLKIV